jgi:protocatechuate 3,4-dioxygenase beta subunit
MTERGRNRVVARRRVLTGLTAGAALLATGRIAKAACPPVTPAQPEGPFYPVAIGEDDWDLTRVAGGSGRAAGEVIEVTGQVLDDGCKPLPGSIVEIWQANVHGLYDHPRDRPGGREFDPNFQGYARLTADQEGRYRFVTIIPGAYPAASDWVRPPHIHYKIGAPSGRSFTTQMYFAGHPLNDKDRLLAQLSPAARKLVEVTFDTKTADGRRHGIFSLVFGTG